MIKYLVRRLPEQKTLLGWHEGQKLGNHNVPDGVEIVGSLVSMSGEIVTTYYIQYYKPAHPQYGGWANWKVGNWSGDKPTGWCHYDLVKLGVRELL